MIDVDTRILTHNGSMALTEISLGQMAFDHHDNIIHAQIGTQGLRRGYRVVLSDESSVVVDTKHEFGGITVETMLKEREIPYITPTVEPVDFLNNSNVSYQDGVTAIFNTDAEHLSNEILYGNLVARQQVFTGMQDGFRDIDGGFIATVFSQTYAEDIANFCRSLGHDAQVYYTYKGIRYWNIVIKRGPRRIVDIEKVDKRYMLEISNVVTTEYIAV